MTNDQITEKLAGVMGWKKGPFPGGEEDGVWYNEQGNGERWIEDFDPLNDHNAMALVRNKRRSDGWRRQSQDGTKNIDGEELKGTWVFYNKQHTWTQAWHKDELMAEALAILDSLNKEGK